MSKLYVVATPIGNLSDFTFRAIDTLKNVDMILCEDTRHSLKLLNNYNIKNKLQSYHKFNEKKKSQEIIDKMLEQDIDVALISDAGTPCISDPGYYVVKLAHEKEIEVYGIPGASAAITSLSTSGLNSNSFAFYGFLEREESKIRTKLLKIRENNVKTSIIYESPKRLLKLVNIIYSIFPNSYISISSDLTKLHEKNIYGSTENVLFKLKNYKEVEKGEYVIIIENNEILSNEEYQISKEALIFDLIKDGKYTYKEAIKEITDRTEYSKNEIYQASLHLKKILEKII